MTVEVDRRYADAKARIRRSDREELVTRFRAVYGERGDAVLAQLTASSPTGVRPDAVRPRHRAASSD